MVTRRRRRITDAQRRKRVEPLLNAWTRRLGLLGEWSITYRFVNKLGEDGIQPFAEVATDLPYHRVYLAFSRQHIDAAPRIELELVIVHELAHLLLWEIKHTNTELIGKHSCLGIKLNDVLEGAVDRVTNTLMALHYGRPVMPYQDQNLLGGGKA